jgi:DNA polymerase III delta subunit
MAKIAGPFIVVFGDEDYEIDRFVAIRRHVWKDREIIVRDATVAKKDDTFTEQHLVTLLDTKSFDDEGRLIILDNAQEMEIDTALAECVEKRSATNTSTVLIAIIRSGGKLPEVWAEAAKKGARVSFAKFKPWEDDKVIDRIVKEATSFKIKLDDGIATLVYKFLGDNLRLTVNELRKLSYLVGEGGLVKKEHIAQLLVASVEVEPREVAEAALNKDKRAVLSRMSRIFKDQGEAACVPLVSSCLYQVEKILVIRHMLDQGLSVDAIAERYGKKAFYIQKHFLPTAQKHTVKGLVGHMKKLCEVEAQVKGAARSKRTLVELAVLSIAA